MNIHVGQPIHLEGICQITGQAKARLKALGLDQKRTVSEAE